MSKKRNSRDEIIPGVALVGLINLLIKLELANKTMFNITMLDAFLRRHPMPKTTSKELKVL